MGRNKSRIEEIKKECRKCGGKLQISSFYTNRDWNTELYKDAWCKECVRKFVVSEKTLKDYCQYNRRVWQQDLYDWCLATIENELSENAEYQNMKDANKKNEIFLTKVFKGYFKQMGNTQYYRLTSELSEHEIKDINAKATNNPNSSSELILDYGEKQYNQEWHGFYTKGELEYLKKYYDGLQRDFKLENSAYIDYAKKVCKASLAMDKAFSDMLDGKSGAEKRYKDFKDIFDQLSQSAKFAEKTRSENDSAGLGSLGEVVKKLEMNGFLQKKVEFEKDDIDMIIDDFRWILASVGEEF